MVVLLKRNLPFIYLSATVLKPSVDMVTSCPEGNREYRDWTAR